MEFEQAETEQPQPKRRRRSTKHLTAACCSCQKRRKKCDGAYPRCQSCVKLGIECTVIFHAMGREIRRNYIESLEDEVATLRAKLAAGASGRLLPMPLGLSLGASGSAGGPPATTATGVLHRLPSSKAEPAGSDTQLYQQQPQSSPHTNSDKPTSEKIQNLINTSLNIFTKEKDQVGFYHGTPSPKPRNSFRTPSRLTAKNLMQVYKRAVQSQYPFLDWAYIEQCYEDVIVQKSQQDKTASFFIFMVLAIGSQLSHVPNSSDNYTKEYYDVAFESAQLVVTTVDLKCVQAYLLMAIFSQKVSDGDAVWMTTGMALRACSILGLHQAPPATDAAGAELQNLKSRIFWSAYGIERLNGLVLGRPFAISDPDITTPYPLENEDSKVSNSVLKLRVIQSNISSFIYNNARNEKINDDSTKIGILIELNEWMSAFPNKEGDEPYFESHDWCTVSYHNSILYLLKPTINSIAKNKLNSSKRDFEWFKIFTESASICCIIHTKLMRSVELNYSWLTMHCCFMAGMSFLYCIWIDMTINVLQWKRDSIIYETINACSSLLSKFAQKWERCTIFKDSFERLSKNVLNQLERNSSVTLIQTTNENQNQNPILLTAPASSISNNTTGPNNTPILSSSSSAPVISQISPRVIHQVINDAENGLLLNDIDIDSYVRTPNDIFSFDDIEPLNKHSLDKPEDIGTTGSTGANVDINDHAGIWDFLDTTGDIYLKNLYNDMEGIL